MESGAGPNPDIAARFKALEYLIGNTPLLAIHLRYHGEPRVVYAKYEQVNMTGSIKDRMALHVLRQAYATGRIKPGDTIAEATSGNTGIAFAAIGRALGHPVTDLHARLDERRAHGAHLELRRADRPREPGAGRVPRQHPPVRGTRGPRARRVPAVPVLERSQRRRAHADDRAGDLVPAAAAGPDARCVRRGRRHGRHGHGRRPLPPHEEPRGQGASRSSRRNRRRSARATRWGSTGSRASPTSSSRRS